MICYKNNIYSVQYPIFEESHKKFAFCYHSDIITRSTVLIIVEFSRRDYATRSESRSIFTNTRRGARKRCRDFSQKFDLFVVPSQHGMLTEMKQIGISPMHPEGSLPFRIIKWDTEMFQVWVVFFIYLTHILKFYVPRYLYLFLTDKHERIFNKIYQFWS